MQNNVHSIRGGHLHEVYPKIGGRNWGWSENDKRNSVSVCWNVEVLLLLALKRTTTLMNSFLRILVPKLNKRKRFCSSCQIFLMYSKYCSMKSWCSTWKWPKIEQFQYTASFLFDCLHEFLLHGIRLILTEVV